MNRILIVNVNWLGDTVFVTPLIRAIKEEYPDSYLAILTHLRCKEVIEGNTYIDEIIIYDEKERHSSLLSKISVIKKLKSKRFDTAFVLRASLSRGLVIFFSGIPNRIGYYNKKSGWLLTKRITPPNKYIHKVEYFLGIGKAIGIKPKSINYNFFISIEDKDRAIELLKEEGIGQEEDFIVINPGGNWGLKRWAIENFARLGDEVFSRYNIKAVLTGSVRDIYLCQRIADLMKHKPVLLCGKTDLKTLGAVFTKAKWVVSNDSGPMHIAVAVSAPVIALFGPTSSSITGPYGDGMYKILEKDIECKKPCYNLKCKDNRCMKAITVDDVLEVIG